MHNVMFMAYVDFTNKKRKNNLKTIPKSVLLTLVIWFALLLCLFIFGKLYPDKPFWKIISIAFCVLALIIYVVNLRYDMKFSDVNIEKKREQYVELYTWLSDRKYSKKNQIKQLRNEVKIEINKMVFQNEIINKTLNKIFELVCIPLFFAVFNQILIINDINSEDKILLCIEIIVYSLLILLGLILPIYKLAMSIKNQRLNRYIMFELDLQGVLDTKFPITPNDILPV